MTRTRLIAWLAAIWLGTGACTVNIPGNNTTLFATGESYIVKGTATVVDDNGPCPVWIGQNGITYQLFQGGRLENADFDRITTQGVTSRLEIVTRSDIAVACQAGQVVEVQRVLEIVE